MINNILVGYDGSESAAHALTFAVGLARVLGSSVHVLAVVRPPEFRSGRWIERPSGGFE